MQPFGVIVADPPWDFGDPLAMSSTKRGSKANYRTMPVQEIEALPVAEVAAQDAVLVLWCPATLLAVGMQVMECWGFEFKQEWIWLKTKKGVEKDVEELEVGDLAFGMGRLARSCKEVMLVGVRGKVYGHLKDKSVRDVFPSQNLKHSQKPESVQDALERMFPDMQKLELFGRRDREGWLVLGDQVPGMEGVDIVDSLSAVYALIKEG